MTRGLIRFRDGYKYQLVDSYYEHISIRPARLIAHAYFDLNTDGGLTVRAGYAWDGASGPAIDTEDFLRGSLVHDVLYQAIGLGLLPASARRAADDELRRICLDDGMWRVRAWWVYRIVRRVGGLRLRVGARPVRVAPRHAADLNT